MYVSEVEMAFAVVEKVLHMVLLVDRPSDSRRMYYRLAAEAVESDRVVVVLVP